MKWRSHDRSSGKGNADRIEERRETRVERLGVTIKVPERGTARE